MNSDPEGTDSDLIRSVHQLMRSHRSVRQFTHEPVTDAEVEAAVDASRHAATSSWIHGYHLLQVTDPGARVRLKELTGGQAQVLEAGAFFVVCGDTRRHRRVARREGAPHVESTETFLLSVIDATLFAQNLTLAFEAMGLGACYIGGLRNDLEEVMGLLEIPDGVFPLFGMTVGRPAAGALSPEHMRPRMEARDLWSKDRYPEDSAIDDAIRRFDQVAGAYYRRRDPDSKRNWSGGIWRKFRRVLRPGLKAAYESRGASFD